MRIMILGDSALGNRLSSHLQRHSSCEVQHHRWVDSDEVLLSIAAFRPHVVVNGTAVESDDPSTFVHNSKNPAVYALYARMVGARFYHLSDSSVFNTNMPQANDEPYPTRVYGLSRLIGERAVVALHPKAVIVRTSWLYGPELPECPPMVAWSAREGYKKNAHIYDDVNLTPTFVGDAAAILAFNLVNHSTSGVFHLGPVEPTTWFDYLRDAFPDILPLKGNRMRTSVRQNVSVAPSGGWVAPEGGLRRFMSEVEDGNHTEGSEVGDRA